MAALRDRGLVLLLLVLLGSACAPAAVADEEGATSTSESGEAEPCAPPEPPVETWTRFGFDALPEFEAGAPLGNVSLTLACSAELLDAQPPQVELSLACADDEGGAATLTISTRSPAAPAPLPAGPLSLEITAFPLDAPDTPLDPHVLRARYQRVALFADEDLVFGFVHGVGASFVDLGPLSAVLETPCPEVGKDELLAGHYRVSLGGEELVLGTDERGQIGEWSLSVFQAEVHGCCAGDVGSLLALRI